MTASPCRCSGGSGSSSSRIYLNKENVGGRMENPGGLSVLSHTNPNTNSMDLNKSKEAPNPFSIPKHQQPSYLESEFGLVSSDSLLNPSHKSSRPFPHSRSFGLSPSHKDHPETAHSLRRFMDDWPNTQQQSHRSPMSMSWPDMGLQSDQTQLSISIPTNKMTLSPLRLSHELDPIQMSLGVGNKEEAHNRQANWIPVSWEAASVGGPLGEVLHTTNGHGGSCRNSSALNLMTDGWDGGGGSSPPVESSPTGVLQKPFGSLSNSSAGSSPRALEGASLCNDRLVNAAASMPSL